MKQRRIAFLILLVGLMVISTGCGGGDQNTSSNEPAADNNNMSDNPTDGESAGDGPMEPMVISSDLVLDSAVIALDDLGSQIVSGYIYDTLVVLDSQGRISPGLALSYDISDQGLEYEFSLRTDAVFADGTQVTADVILNNFNRWFDPEHPLHGADSSAYAAWLENFKGFRGELDADGKPFSLFDGIEKVDDLTVLVHLNQAMDDFLEVIAQPFFSILNLDAMGAGYGMMDSDIDGSGAYMLKEWTSDGLTLTPNSDYWGEIPADELHFIFE